MKIGYSPTFKKHFQKRIATNPRLFSKTSERIALFQENPRNEILKDHALVGKRSNLRAFSITGDIRIIYLPVSEDVATFIDIGSHNQVY